jgi:hypothetical protein
MSKKPVEPAKPVSRGQRLKFAEAVWGWRPHAAQAAVWMSAATNKTEVCGRRFGKTEGGALDDVTCLLLVPGWSSMVVAPSRDQVMINYQEAKAKLESDKDLRRLFRCRETPHPEISIDDRVILYRTAGDDGKYIRGHGKKIKRIRVDEAAYVKQSVVEGVIEPMCLDMGAELVLQGTPFGKNYFFLRYREGQAGDSRYDGFSQSWQFPTATNPHLDRRAYGRIQHRLGADSLQWRCEYLAEFVDSASAVFGWDLIESCFYDPKDSKGRPLSYASYFAGIDLARYSDYTVVAVGGFDRGLIHICDMDRFNQIDWVQQKARIFDKIERYKAQAAIDATGEGDAVVDDLVAGEWLADGDGRSKKRSGLMLEKVRITSNAIKRDLIDKLKVRMSQGLLKIPYGSADSATGESRWDLMVDELKYYSYTLTESGNIKFAADAGYHDDIVMALALLMKKAYGQFETRRESVYFPPESWGRVCAEIDASANQEERVAIG